MIAIIFEFQKRSSSSFKSSNIGLSFSFAFYAFAFLEVLLQQCFLGQLVSCSEQLGVLLLEIMASSIFSAETEEEFLSFEREYDGGTDTDLDESEKQSDVDESEVDSDAAEESSDPTIEPTAVPISDPEFEKEKQHVCKFMTQTCGCKLGPKLTPCSNVFSRENIIDQRERCFELEKFELDMVVLGQLQAFQRNVSTDESTQRNTYMEFLFHGRRVCRETFMFLHTLSQKKYRTLLVHYSNAGLVSREHGNLHSTPHNRVPFEAIQAIVTFITRFAEIHAMPLPGRMPNHKSKALLLPSDISKSEVYRQYKQACTDELSHKPVSWAKFHNIWSTILPHVDTMKPSSDLCFECQQHATQVLHSANETEQEKVRKLEMYQQHIKAARMQREHYNNQCKEAKAKWELHNKGDLYDDIMHYSFDYAQNVQFPCNPQQPGPAYFKSARKCGIFGVSCEPLSLQINYLIDEDDDPGKGSNATVSLIHHFIETHAVGKQKILFQADNCVGQNKNNTLMQYLMWRVMSGQSVSAEISFMIVGHTKFSPDRFFGLIKKKYKHTFVSTLDEIKELVTNSMLTGKNIPQLTKTESGSRLVLWYDWKSYLNEIFKPIPNITIYHHFRFENTFPGVVFVRELVNSPEKAIAISSAKTLDSQTLPQQVIPKEMTIARKWYLFDEIAKFCSSQETASVTCPRPSQPKPSSNPIASSASNTAEGTKTKRKRACSHCHHEGHTKTKKGKITCPKLLQK